MEKKIWFIPKQLDRKFSLKEKLATWIFGRYTSGPDGKTQIRPYALARSFNKHGYTDANPYLYFSYFGSIRYLIEEEQRYGATTCKTMEAAELYADELERVEAILQRLRKKTEK